MMARTRVLLAVALLAGTATACSDVTGNVNAEGAFYLQTVNGVQVPYQYTDNSGNTITVESDTYSLDSDGTYNEVQNYRVNGSFQSGTEFGAWSQSGNTVYFTPQQSDFSLTPYQGTVRNSGQFNGSSRTLTLSINGVTAVYSD
jgi:hypothetical protein